MKNGTPIFLFLFGIIAIIYAFYTRDTSLTLYKKNIPKSQHTLNNKIKKTAITNDSHQHVDRSLLHPPQQITKTSKITTVSAVNHMNSLLKTYTSEKFQLNDVIKDLENRKMDPVVLKDSNPYTGTMFVLRTESPIPNTRYFHAQYFSDNKNSSYLQHMSFDIKPEKTTFQDAITSIKKIFGQLGKPTIDKKDFIMWPWKNGYNLWVQKLDRDQLSGDPFNAYTTNDVGTVKVAVELDTFHEHSHAH